MCLSYILIYDNTFRDIRPRQQHIKTNDTLLKQCNILEEVEAQTEYRRTYLLYLLPKEGERKNGTDKDLGNPKSGSGGGVISGHFDTNLEVEVSFCLLRERINS